jgi:hypothetical protein
MPVAHPAVFFVGELRTVAFPFQAPFKSRTYWWKEQLSGQKVQRFSVLLQLDVDVAGTWKGKFGV